jgi:hypothetical protein
MINFPHADDFPHKGGGGGGGGGSGFNIAKLTGHATEFETGVRSSLDSTFLFDLQSNDIHSIFAWCS